MIFKHLFCPSSAAVIGAAREEGKVGHDILDNIVASGFPGPCYPVNPKAQYIHDLKCYPSVLDIEGQVDLAIIAVPNKIVPEIVEQCGQKGVRNAIIISAGFKEAGIEGLHLEKQVLKWAEKYGMRILGPNCLGLINTKCPLNASFAKEMPAVGDISFISQSGALCTAILDYAKADQIGFAKFVSLGNKADITETDLLEDWLEDEDAAVVALYVEGVKEGKEFMDASYQLSLKKPIVAIKSGTTDSGARAVSSHTGTLAGSERAYEAAFRQSGIVQARSVQDLFDFSIAFSYQALPQGQRVAIITNAGGPGIMATDACEKGGIPLANFSRKTVERLREFLPPAANVYNPVDVLGDALADRYRRATEVVLADDNVDALILILTPQAMTEITATAEALAEATRGISKTVLSCFMGKADVDKGIKILNQNKIPNYYFPERAAESLKVMIQYAQFLKEEKRQYQKFDVDKARVKQIFEDAIRLGRRNLPEADAREVLAAYVIRIPKSRLVRGTGEAKRAAQEIGFPVVLKIASPNILHKSDVGGIKVGIESEKELERAYREILWNANRFMPEATIWGVLVQEMVPYDREVIVGVNRDPQFGPLVMFGLGGIYVEVLKDVSFRVAPLTERDAQDMIQEIRSFPLLSGVRGQPRADLASLKEILLRVSQLVTEFPQINEMDINPIKVGGAGEGAVAVDARITLEE